jgi:tellurite resistance-related uncharacterized protein
MDPEVRINVINKEVRGLINSRAFSLVHVDAEHSHVNIIGTRNITRLKHFDIIDEETKAPLTIQECHNAEKNRIVFNAPTVSHASIRILISFAAIKVYPVWTKETTHAFLQSMYTLSRDLYAEKNRIVSNAPTVSYSSIRILISFAAIKVHPVWTEDTTHAFLQRKNTFSRDLYAMLPLELRSVFKGYVLKMLKPLYGTKEARTYWNTAYSGDWKQKAGITPYILVPCFMTKTCNQAKNARHGIAAILVDGSLMNRNKQFEKAEERIHSNYDIGQAQTITNGLQIKLGGVQIGRDPNETLRILHQVYMRSQPYLPSCRHFVS